MFEHFAATQLVAMRHGGIGLEPSESDDAAVDVAGSNISDTSGRSEKDEEVVVQRPSDDLSSVLDLDADSCSICLDPFTDADPAIVSFNYFEF